MYNSFQIFISFKATEKGVITDDVAKATELYNSLTELGLKVFFSPETLPNGRSGDFQKEIDSALDEAKLLIVVGTKIEYINSRWVEYEWKTFNSDILSNVKGEAQIITYTSNIDTKNLPRILRYVQNFNFKDKESLLTFASNFINGEKQIELPINKQHQTNNTPKKKKSKILDHTMYNSASKGEFEILRLRGRRSYQLDISAIDYVKTQMNKEKYNVLVLGCAYGFVAETRFGLDDSIENVICVDKNEDVLNKARELYSNYPHMKFYNIDIQGEEYVNDINKITNDLGIEGIDIVFVSDVFRYLNKVQTTVRNTRKILNNGGYLIIRDCDDSNKIAYPDKKNILKEIVNSSLSIQGMPNYYIGRELPLIIRNSGFKVCDIKIDLLTTVKMTFEEKEEFFIGTFGSRKNIAKQILEIEDSSKETVESFIKSIDKFEEIFYDLNFWYRESNLVFIAKKTNN